MAALRTSGLNNHVSGRFQPSAAGNSPTRQLFGPKHEFEGRFRSMGLVEIVTGIMPGVFLTSASRPPLFELMEINWRSPSRDSAYDFARPRTKNGRFHRMSLWIFAVGVCAFVEFGLCFYCLINRFVIYAVRVICTINCNNN